MHKLRYDDQREEGGRCKLYFARQHPQWMIWVSRVRSSKFLPPSKVLCCIVQQEGSGLVHLREFVSVSASVVTSVGVPS